MADRCGLSAVMISVAAGLDLLSSVEMIGGGSAPLVSFLWLLPLLLPLLVSSFYLRF